MPRECISHHAACDCREAYFENMALSILTAILKSETRADLLKQVPGWASGFDAGKTACREERFRRMEEALKRISQSNPYVGERWIWCVETAANALKE